MVSSFVRDNRLSWNTLCTHQVIGISRRCEAGPMFSRIVYGPRHLAASFLEGASVLRLYDSNHTLSPTVNVRFSQWRSAYRLYTCWALSRANWHRACTSCTNCNRSGKARTWLLVV